MSGSKGKFAISRRTLLAGGAAFSALPSRRAFAQSSEPLRIGFLTVKTGPLAAGGKQQEEGVALFLKERNGTIEGRKIELITQDTAGNPALARPFLPASHGGRSSPERSSPRVSRWMSGRRAADRRRQGGRRCAATCVQRRR